MSTLPPSSSLLNLWSDPPAAYRGKPFWSWNGRLEKGELLRQIGVLKDMGFGGFFMHSRTGLVTEYLGDEWFDLINACADEAERLGMEAWLYDDDRWPSGSAGGIATRDPQYRMRYLRMKMTPSESFTWNDGILAAFSCSPAGFHGEGFQYHDGRRITESEAASVSAGKTVLTFHVEVMAPDSFYNGSSYLDTMNSDATRHFLDVTHERYAARCGDRLGRSIKGIFTDEPHRGMVMSSFADHPHSSWVIPWTDKLCEEFETRFGSDLVSQLPEIFLQPFGQNVTQVKWQYMELLQTLFLENFMRPVQDWCREHDLLLTGHLLHEDSLCCQAVPNGSMIRNYEFMDFPGIDVLTEVNVKFWIVKQLSSAARQLGKDWLLSELYGCAGWQMTFQGHKAVGDWQALFGINVRCPHLSWYTMEGEAKRDYPASILHQSAWHSHYGYVEDYFSRIHVALSRGTPVCGLLVINPVESVWAQIRHGWVNHLTGSIAPIQNLERTFEEVFQWLSGTQLDFDYGDEDFLARMASIATDGDEPELVVGQARYRAVLVAGLSTMRGTTLDLLEAFADAGGELIFAGEVAGYVDALPSGRIAALRDRTTFVPFYPDALTRACRKAVPPQVEVLDPEGRYNIPSVFAQVRDTEDGRFVMLLRTQRERYLRGSVVRLRGHGHVEEWDCRTGERWNVEARRGDGWLEFTTDFAPSGEHLYRIVDAPDATLARRVVPEETRREALDIEFPFRLNEPNVCVLDRAAHRIDGGEWQEPQEILRADRAIRSALDLDFRGGRMLQPWFRKGAVDSTRARVGLRFEFHVEVLPRDSVELILEHSQQYVSISINGTPLDAKGASGWWVDKCFDRISIPAELLRTGTNAFEFELDFHERIDIEAIYLAGDFGVRVAGSGARLIELPKALVPGCVTEQGLPFYGGAITYQIPTSVIPRHDGAGMAWVRLPSCEAACVRVSDGGCEPKMIAFEPLEAEVGEWIEGAACIELEVILTRRNTFGPLHQVPLLDTWYGPENWTTDGASFSEDYVLHPAGLLVAPEMIWKTCGNDATP
ncbi:MAG: hypothetical protein WA771_12085 [Chthoniobacterales bacterium]